MLYIYHLVQYSHVQSYMLQLANSLFDPKGQIKDVPTFYL